MNLFCHFIYRLCFKDGFCYKIPIHWEKLLVFSIKRNNNNNCRHSLAFEHWDPLSSPLSFFLFSSLVTEMVVKAQPTPDRWVWVHMQLGESGPQDICCQSSSCWCLESKVSVSAYFRKTDLQQWFSRFYTWRL